MSKFIFIIYLLIRFILRIIHFAYFYDLISKKKAFPSIFPLIFLRVSQSAIGRRSVGAAIYFDPAFEKRSLEYRRRYTMKRKREREMGEKGGEL